MLPFDIFHFPVCEHLDTIHHVEFDYYGKRIATSSSDKVVCIWDRSPNNNSWFRSAYWKKHGGAVWKVRFAHPEYGQILATSSFDNTIQIYDKDSTELNEQISQAGIHVSRMDTSNGWSRRATLISGLTTPSSALDIQFAPHHLGLRLAACTASGCIIIWDAEDIMALENWNPIFNIENGPYRLSSLTWSLNRFNAPLIIVSSDDVNTPSNLKIIKIKLNFNTMTSKQITEGKFDFEDQVSYVSFGPSSGLTHHNLAIAAGTRIYIYKINVPYEEDLIITRYNQEIEFTTNLVSKLEGGDSQVIRISWSILGDVLTAVFADGLIRIWKYVAVNKWSLISVVNPPEELEKSNKNNVYY